MLPKFVASTSNVKRFLSGIGLLEGRGAEEASWLAAIGEPGYGKTRAIKWWATQNRGVYVRAKSTWRPNWMLSELTDKLTGHTQEGSTATLFKAVLNELAKTGGYQALVVDEAWNMMHDSRLLETLRDLSDAAGVMVILGGELRVTAKLARRYPQIASRISEVVAFEAATPKDVRLCCDELSEVTVADDLVAEIHRQSNGYYREIKNAIAKVEVAGRRMGGKPVSLADIGGRELCRDRKGGLPSVRSSDGRGAAE